MGEDKTTPGEQEPKVVEKENPRDKKDEYGQKKHNSKPATAADPFLLEEIYSDACQIFAPNELLTPRSKSVLVALDTNVLLLPYNLGKGDFPALGNVYSNLAKEGRLFLPERAAREFIKHRDRKLADMAQAIDDKASRLGNWDTKLTSLLLEGFPGQDDLIKSGDNLGEATKKYTEMLHQLSAYVKSWRGNDPVTVLYQRIFTKENIIRPSEDNDKIIEKLKYAILNKVPPGYKDSDKEDSGVGDLVIWMSLLNLGKETKKDLIFVTGEEKADWYVRAGKNTIYPRPELVYAYRQASSGRSLRLSSLHDVLKEMSAPEELVTDIQRAEVSANNALQSTSSIKEAGSLMNTEASYENSLIKHYKYYKKHGLTSSQSLEDDEFAAAERAETLRRLRELKAELSVVRREITALTNDDANQSLTLPWNRAAYGARLREQDLISQIQEIRQQNQMLSED